MSAQLQPGGAPSASGDPTQGDTTGDPSSDQTGFIVCIAALPDGTYQIYSQDGDDDQDDASDASQGSGGASAASVGADAGTASDSDSAQTADNVDDALAIAKMMLEQEADEDSGSDSGDGNAMMSPDDAKAAWNQMASKRDKKRASM